MLLSDNTKDAFKFSCKWIVLVLISKGFLHLRPISNISPNTGLTVLVSGKSKQINISQEYHPQWERAEQPQLFSTFKIQCYGSPIIETNKSEIRKNTDIIKFYYWILKCCESRKCEKGETGA